MMEADGIVSKANHVGKRDVLIMLRSNNQYIVILNFYNPSINIYDQEDKIISKMQTY